MAYGYVATQDAISTASAASVARAYPRATTPGNLLISSVYAFGIGVGAVSISGWAVAASASFVSAADSTTILYKVADGTETNVSAASSGATSMGIAVHEFASGRIQAIQTPLDQSNSGNTASLVTSQSAGSITPSKTNELVVVAMSFPTGGVTSPTFDSGASVMSSNANLVDGFLVSQNTNVIAPTASWTGLSVAGGCIASFFVGSQGDSLHNHLIIGGGMSRSEVAN